MNHEQKDDAVRYVTETYCDPSDDNIETDVDHDSPDTAFGEGKEGVWVQGWLFCPASEITSYERE